MTSRTGNNPADRVFIVGAGPSEAVRKNAFEVSNNGHSIVYHENGTGASNAGIYGATYDDNIVYAWGDIDTMSTAPSGMHINSDFGVSSVTRFLPGQYIVTVNTADPYGAAFNGLTGASITVTLCSNDNPPCLIVAASSMGGAGLAPNQFKIWLVDPTSSCNPKDHRVMFKVCGRK